MDGSISSSIKTNLTPCVKEVSEEGENVPYININESEEYFETSQEYVLSQCSHAHIFDGIYKYVSTNENEGNEEEKEIEYDYIKI